jgi:hypothetical protein
MLSIQVPFLQGEVVVKFPGGVETGIHVILPVPGGLGHLGQPACHSGISYPQTAWTILTEKYTGNNGNACIIRIGIAHVGVTRTLPHEHKRSPLRLTGAGTSMLHIEAPSN